MRTLGIDPGLNTTGYGELDFAGGQPRLIEAGVRGKAGTALAERMREIHDGVADVIAALELLMTTIKELAGILGLFGEPPAPADAAGDDLLAELMPLVIELRAAARKNKNFAAADKIRDTLAPLGITLEDRAGGTEWTTT